MRKLLLLISAFAFVAVLSLPLFLTSASPLRAEISGPVVFAGDSVRFVARFNPPSGPVADSIVVRWSVGGNGNQFKRYVAPYAAAISDTALFSAPATLGGGNVTGDITVTVWRAGLSSGGVQKALTITLPNLPAPGNVTGLVFTDSATVINP